jgi:hypothetical protein
MAGGDPQAPLDQVQPHHPKENPAVAGGGFLCPTKVEGVLVGAFYARRRTPTSFPYETENKNGSQLTVRGQRPTYRGPTLPTAAVQHRA